MKMKKKQRLQNKINAKIQARYILKYNEFITKTPEELKEIFQITKMSSTDRKALIDAVHKLLEQQNNLTKTAINE